MKWYGINEAFELAKDKPRPILLDVYTNWNSWCDYMMKTTFANKTIADYINANFYAARLNAETLDTIDFQGKKYFNRNIGRRSANDLAIKLLDGNLTYPSIILFGENGERLVASGYKEHKDIEPYLVYFAEKLHTKTSIDSFIIDFMFTFPAAFEKDHSIYKIPSKMRPDTLGKINWMAPQEIKKSSKKKGKPVLIYFYTNWDFSSVIMEKISLRNAEIAEKINHYYSPVKVNVGAPTVSFLGKTYNLAENDSINEIVYQYLSEHPSLPSLVIFDENLNFIKAIKGYLKKEELLPLTDYFYNKVYKKHSMQEYFKNFETSISSKKKTKEEN